MKADMDSRPSWMPSMSASNQHNNTLYIRITYKYIFVNIAGYCTAANLGKLTVSEKINYYVHVEIVARTRTTLMEIINKKKRHYSKMERKMASNLNGSIFTQREV